MLAVASNFWTVLKELTNCMFCAVCCCCWIGLHQHTWHPPHTFPSWCFRHQSGIRLRGCDIPHITCCAVMKTLTCVCSEGHILLFDGRVFLFLLAADECSSEDTPDTCAEVSFSSWEACQWSVRGLWWFQQPRLGSFYSFGGKQLDLVLSKSMSIRLSLQQPDTLRIW